MTGSDTSVGGTRTEARKFPELRREVLSDWYRIVEQRGDGQVWDVLVVRVRHLSEDLEAGVLVVGDLEVGDLERRVVDR